jgi:tetratricopeptide (TPR) repeat protein
MNSRRVQRTAACFLLFACVVGSPALNGCDDSSARLAKIDRLMETNSFEESIELLEAQLVETPNDPRLLYLYGMAHMGLSRPTLAIWPFLTARNHPDWELKAGLAVVHAAMASGDYDLAIQSASLILEDEPDHAVARGLLAESRIAAKAYEEALEDANQLIDLDEENFLAQILRLQALMGLERIEEVEADFDTLEAMWTDESFPQPLAEQYCTARAIFASEKGDNAESSKRFDSCLESFPNGRIVLMGAVSFFDQSGNSERATELLEAAVEREPSASDLTRALAKRLVEKGDPQAATRILIQATKEAEAGHPDAWITLAYHYFSLDEFEQSVRAWEEGLDLLPQPDEGILFSYAESLVRAHQFEAAERVATSLPEYLAELTRGLVELERGEPEAALEHFDAGQREWPNNAAARFFAGVAAERAADIDRAIVEFRHSIRIEADETPAALHLARILNAEGHFEAAQTALGHYLPGHPTDVEGNLLSLRIAARLRGPAFVERIFPAYRWPRDQVGSIVGEAAEIVLTTGGPEAALRFLTTVGHIDFRQPRNADATRVFVLALARSGRPDVARDTIGEALEAHPESAALHEVRASLLEYLGAEASVVREAHHKALELDSEFPRSLSALAESAVNAGQETEARRLFERAAAADPKDFTSRRRAAELAASAGEIDAARRQLQSLLDDSPQDVRAAINLARILHQRGDDPDRAAKLARLAVRYRGGSDAFEILNQVHFSAGTVDQAIEVLQSASLRQGSDPSLHYRLGQALRRIGESSNAAAAFKRALALGADRDFPERTVAEKAIAELSTSASASKEQPPSGEDLE